MALKKRPFKSLDSKTETIYSYYDEQIRNLDNRRITKTNKLSSDASLDDVIRKVNNLIEKINNSEMTR